MNRRSFLRSALVAFAATTALGRVSLAVERSKKLVVLDSEKLSAIVDASRELLADSVTFVHTEELIRVELARAFAERIGKVFLLTSTNGITISALDEKD